LYDLQKAVRSESNSIRKIQLYYSALVCFYIDEQISENEFKNATYDVVQLVRRNSSRPRDPNQVFNINHLFVSFYFVVKKLVEYHLNWHQFTWVKSEQKLTSSLMDRIMQKRCQSWLMVFNITTTILLKTKTAVFENITPSCSYG